MNSPDLTSEQPMIFTRYLMHNMSNKNTLKVSDGTIVRWDNCNGRGDQLQMLKFRTCNPTQKSQRCFLHMDPMAALILMHFLIVQCHLLPILFKTLKLNALLEEMKYMLLLPKVFSSKEILKQGLKIKRSSFSGWIKHNWIENVSGYKPHLALQNERLIQ